MEGWQGMLFRKKDSKVEFTTYEADSLYYDQYIAPQQAPSKKRYKKRVEEIEDYYYQIDDVNEAIKTVDNRNRSNIFVKVIVVLIAYIAFIVIGIFSTSYTTNEIGEKEPQIINFSILKERESFYRLREQYLIIRNIIFRINEIDLQFLENKEGELFMISTQYQDVLPEIDRVLPIARAIVVDTKYNSLKKQAESIYESIAIYLQKMGSSLIENNKTTYEEALTWRKKYFYDFERFRLNLIEFSKIVKIEDKSLVDNLPEIFSLETEMDNFSIDIDKE